MFDYSVLIFSFREARTIERAILACIREADAIGRAYEICVVAPDEETKKIVERVAQTYSQVRFIQDQGRGKPAAINLALADVKSPIVVFTDGDVMIEKESFVNLLAPLNDTRIGAVSGHPIPQDARDTKYGFWAWMLTQAGAHEMRLRRQTRGESIEASAYLMAVRRELIAPLPEDTFADDQVISFMVLNAGRKIAYAPDARVLVKYPTNFHDWKLQKVRSVAGYYQTYARHQSSMRSGVREAGGIGRMLHYPNTLREWWWFKQLIVARAIVWMSAWWSVNVVRKSFSKIWRRVESTK